MINIFKNSIELVDIIPGLRDKGKDSQGFIQFFYKLYEEDLKLNKIIYILGFMSLHKIDNIITLSFSGNIILSKIDDR